MKKGFTSILLCLAVIFSFIALPVHAATSGKCGKNVTWSLDSGTLTISGTGDMWDLSTSPWYSSKWAITKVDIQNGVTSIGTYAFNNHSSLTSITIPNSVTSIGEHAFYSCSRLTSITIPNGVTSIGEDAFYLCSSLTSITIPNGVTSIVNFAFYGCSSLTSITIPNGVTSIGYSAFSSCSSLTSITIPNSVTSIEGDAFSYCSSLTSITIPNSVTSIGKCALYGCSKLTSITIPNSVTSIEESAFSGCSSLASITIPNSVTSIGGYAFYNCSSLTNITIPNSVTSIGNSAFHGCSSLTSITIPNTETRIGYRAFYGCSSLTSITIPNSVTSIGEDAFNYCYSLENVKYLGAAEEWGKVAIGDGNTFLLDANIEYSGETRTVKNGTITNGTISADKQYAVQGEEVTLTVTPNTGYVIKNVKYNGIAITPINNIYKFTMPNENVVITAEFEELFTISTSKYVDDILYKTSNQYLAGEKIILVDKNELSGAIANVFVDGVKQAPFEGEYSIIMPSNNVNVLICISSISKEPEEEEGFKAELNVSDDYIIATANVPNIKADKNIHAVVYDKNGKMIDYIIFPSAYSNNTVHFAFKKAENASYIKVFLWDSFSKLTPLSDSITLDIE